MIEWGRPRAFQPSGPVRSQLTPSATFTDPSPLHLPVRLSVVAVLLALPLAGCLGPGAGTPDVPPACAPGDGEDPYPQDEILAERSAKVDGETLRIAACLVNGKGSAHREECGSAAGPIEVEVTNATSGELVFARPPVDVAFIEACQEWSLAADQEWKDARFEEVWDLRKDVCREDAECEREGEGERVPGGDYVVAIRYPSFVGDWRRSVAIPPG